MGDCRVLIWNAEQDWITVRFHSDYQFDDVARWSAVALAASIGTQIGLYSPLLVFGGLAALTRGLRMKGEAWPERWPQLLAPAFAVPPLVVFLIAVLESRASPHWSVLGWLFLIVPAAHWVVSGWQRRGVRARQTRAIGRLAKFT